MPSGLARTCSILAAIVAGALLPQLDALTGAVRWFVMAMLFLVFLQTRWSRAALHRSHAWLLLANIGIGFAAWGLGWAMGGREVALAAFFTGITPTATAAPVIIGFLRGRVDYVVAAFLITNFSITALLPLLLPMVLGRADLHAFGQVLGSVTLVVFVPMTAAFVVRRLHPPAAQWPVRLRNLSFALWVFAIMVICAHASAFLRAQTDAPLGVLLKIVTVSIVICAASFALGRCIGGREFPREASQALGQKNTMFTLYLALAYANPIVALGPTFYVLWHNLWNSWQLHRVPHPAAAPPDAQDSRPTFPGRE